MFNFKLKTIYNYIHAIIYRKSTPKEIAEVEITFHQNVNTFENRRPSFRKSHAYSRTRNTTEYDGVLVPNFYCLPFS